MQELCGLAELLTLCWHLSEAVGSGLCWLGDLLLRVEGTDE